MPYTDFGSQLCLAPNPFKQTFQIKDNTTPVVPLGSTVAQLITYIVSNFSCPKSMHQQAFLDFSETLLSILILCTHLALVLRAMTKAIATLLRTPSRVVWDVLEHLNLCSHGKCYYRWLSIKEFKSVARWWWWWISVVRNFILKLYFIALIDIFGLLQIKEPQAVAHSTCHPKLSQVFIFLGLNKAVLINNKALEVQKDDRKH